MLSTRSVGSLKSDEAARWIDGFLAGSTPHGYALFGERWSDVIEGDPEFDEWTRVAAEFRGTGVWPSTPAP